MQNYLKKGYLTSNFKIFHLTDTHLPEIDFHYHDFHKLLLHLHGNVSYSIDGQTINLHENDIVFVNAGEVHRPIFHDNEEYERIIIYISPDFLKDYQAPENDMTLCFKKARELSSHVLRVPGFWTTKMGSIITELLRSLDDTAYANYLFQQVLFLEFMVCLNRAAVSKEVEFISTNYSNSKISDVINYLNENLTNEISIDILAEQFFLSRYYLMHAFKEETGYTIGGYITIKRLSLAQSLINKGTAISDACYQCGFNNYSTFLRAYKKHFGYTPSNKTPSDATLRF